MTLFGQRGGTQELTQAPAALDLTTFTGYLVADAGRRVVGRVECPMYGTHPERPDALAVRTGFMRSRRIVPADAIETIDRDNAVLTLCVARDAIRSFL